MLWQWLVFLAFLAGSLGRALIDENNCNDPLWTVVGHHWVPRKHCFPIHQTERRNALYQKYLEKFTAVGNPDLDKIEKIFEDLDTLLFGATSTFDELTCAACTAGIETYKYLESIGVRKQDFIGLLAEICVDFNIMNRTICQGALNLYGDALMEIVDTSNKSSSFVCSVLLNTKCGRAELPELQWSINFPKTTKPKSEKPSLPPPSVPSIKVLHLTDTHWDTKYLEGTWSECNFPLCCRKENPLPNSNATKAGKFGGWRCDTPETTFDSVLEHAAKQHPDVQYVIWTGDVPAHDLWSQTKDENLWVLKKTIEKIAAAFPNVPVYPAVGNHESVPGNMFPIGKEAKNPMDWLFNELRHLWSRWLPKNALSTIQTGAYYTTAILPGLRLVSMNMNYCYKMNWWLVKDYKDPLDELQWLVDLLQESENKNEKVHIIGHIPPGSTDCVKTWQTNFYKIINRYESTVTAQFYGHTHSDEYEVFYDMKNTSKPVAVAYVAPSVTTYMYHNPAYRVYYVEGAHKNTNRFVLDHETWYMNLEKSNAEKRADWKKLYSAKAAYKMNSLFPVDWHDLYLRIKNSEETLQLYHKYYWNDSPKRPVCDSKCRKNHLCGIRSCEQYGCPDK